MSNIALCFAGRGVDVMQSVVGRQIKVPSSWFGPDFENDNPNLHFVLDIKELLPAARGLRKRLMLTYGDSEVYFCDRQVFDSSILPFLVPLVALEPEHAEVKGGPKLPLASGFRVRHAVSFDPETQSYVTQGTPRTTRRRACHEHDARPKACRFNLCCDQERMR